MAGLRFGLPFHGEDAAVTAKISASADVFEQRLQQFKVRQQRGQARREAQAMRRTRREDMRRKILVGTIVLARVNQGAIQESVLRGWLEAALTRGDDRALFGLEPLTP
jgi:hypothetical protein